MTGMLVKGVLISMGVLTAAVVFAADETVSAGNGRKATKAKPACLDKASEIRDNAAYKRLMLLEIYRQTGVKLRPDGR